MATRKGSATPKGSKGKARPKASEAPDLDSAYGRTVQAMVAEAVRNALSDPASVQAALTDEDEHEQPKAATPSRMKGEGLCAADGCSEPTAPKRTGGWRKYCPPHRKAAAAAFRQRMADSRAETEARRSENADLWAAAEEAAKAVRTTRGAKPYAVLITPSGCSFGYYAVKHGGGERDASGVKVRFPSKAKASAFAEAVEAGELQLSTHPTVKVVLA